MLAELFSFVVGDGAWNGFEVQTTDFMQPPPAPPCLLPAVVD